MKTYGLFLVLFVAMCGVSWAVTGQAASTSTASAVAATPVWKGILMMALNGALVGVVGYFSQSKNPDGSHETFNVVKFIATVVLGAGIGAFAAWKGKSFDSVEAWIENSGYIAVGELILKAVWRNGSVTLAGLLSSLKPAAANPTLPAPPKP